MAIFPSRSSSDRVQHNQIPIPAAPKSAGTLNPAVQETQQQVALTPDDIAHAQELATRLRQHFSQGLVAQDNLREALITTMVASGHILIESVPGLAKTTAAKLLATAVSGSFKRIQCTPDLMPSDLIGTQIFDFASQHMTTQIGPIHANFVLLDEINRSSAKTQSAMLEAMAEGATTIGGERIALPKPFMVIATQNPIEEEGTYSLPESQMDRFYLKTVLDYPAQQDEIAMLSMLTRRGSDVADAADMKPPLSIGDVEFLRRSARQVHVSQPIMQYAVQLAQTSRGEGPKPIQGIESLVRLGASPRASIALIRIGQASALLSGRDYVIPEDIKSFAHDVFRHRILLTFEALGDSISVDQVIDSMIEAVPVP